MSGIYGTSMTNEQAAKWLDKNNMKTNPELLKFDFNENKEVDDFELKGANNKNFVDILNNDGQFKVNHEKPAVSKGIIFTTENKNVNLGNKVVKGLYIGGATALV